MTHLRRLTYSVSISLSLVTALTLLSGRGPNELLMFLAPGMMVELILTTLLPFGDGESFGFTHQGWAANLAFYSLAIYLLLMLFQALHWFYREFQAEPPVSDRPNKVLQLTAR